jgi:hypothetical protein
VKSLKYITFILRLETYFFLLIFDTNQKNTIMRKLLLSAAILVSVTSFAQEINPCSSTEAMNEWFSQHPDLKQQFEQQQNAAESLDKQLFKNGSYQNKSTSAVAIYTIPVVFHIMHTGGSENISDAQVIDAVNILSRDFQKLNQDTAVVVTPFKNIIGNAQIEFRLAKRDPSGNCTNGIIRHYDTKTDWVSGNLLHYAYSWPRQNYLNIYVVKSISSGAAGYTYLPGSGVPAAQDAIVILSTYVGSIGTGNVGLSRALTHEVGHWLNLPHVWGGTNQPGVACGDEGVSDTPVTKGYTSCALANSDICNPGTPENLQNYMDYSYCCRMYTQGQAIRMQNALNSSVAGRNNLSTPSNLSNTGITNPATNCIPMVYVAATPAATVCSGNTLTIISYTSNTNPSTYSWTANNGATIANAGANNAVVTFNTPGQTTVVCEAITASGSNTAQVVVTVLNAGSIATSPYSESFEGGLPSTWQITNPDAGVTWALTNSSAKTGNNSYFIDGSTNPAGAIDYLQMITVNLNDPNDTLTFEYAYARQSATHNDVFKVEASKDCGGNWTTIYNPSTSQLASGSGGTTSSPFVPTLSQWKHIKLNDYPSWSIFSGAPTVWVRFSFQENTAAGNGNNFYLDDINFSGSSSIGMNELTKNFQFVLYPNPAKGEATVKFKLNDPANVKIDVIDVLGRNVVPASEYNFTGGEQSVNINKNNTLAKGIYFVNLSVNGAKMSKKLVIE